jgi:hypothetical protein
MVQSVSVPAVSATEKTALNRVRLRVPTSIVVTLLGTALTVWLAPALTRQWDDRQHARDLKAAIAAEMVNSAVRTIRDGEPLAEGRGRYDVIRARWLETGLTVKVKQKAYFPTSIVERWKKVVQEVEYFLIVSGDVAAAHEESRQGRVRDPVGYRRDRIRSALILMAPAPKQVNSATAAELLASDDPTARALGMDHVKSWTFAKVEGATDEVLSAHPSGFSTTRGDLLHDLFP